MASGGNVDNGGDDEVHRDHVDHTLGHAGELFQQAAGVADDDGLRHAEAFDPAGERFGPCRLDDRRPNDGDRDVALALIQRSFTEGLGVGVGVRPAEGGGPGPARFDQLFLDPTLANLLGLCGDEWSACGAEFVTGLAAEPLESVHRAGVGVVIGPGPPCGLDLCLPVDVDVERAVAQELLRRAASAVARHVTGRHGHKMR